MDEQYLSAVDDRMHLLEDIIGYKFNDIRNLTNAMCGQKIFRDHSGVNSKDYYNDSLATVGDAILKAILSECLFKKGLYKGDITTIKQMLESNKKLLDMSNKFDLTNYVFNGNGFYNDVPVQDRAPYSKHNQYFEAIIGAVYFDSNYETCRNWLLEKIYPDTLIEEWISKYQTALKNGLL